MVTVDNNIMQHFRPDELEFIEQVQGWIKAALDEYRPVVSHFLNPRQQRITTTLLNREASLKHQFYGGQKHAEMQRVLIYPSYYEPEISDFATSLIQIEYPTKFAKLEHNQILGSLVGLGLNRNIFGDILNNGEIWQFFVENDMQAYVIANLTKIGKIKVRLQSIPVIEALTSKDEWQEGTTTVASLRIDTLIAEVFNLSRSRVKKMIESGNVKLNWVEIIKPDYELTFNDLVSVRHFGRMQLMDILGTTKKEKIRISINKIEISKK